MADVFVRPARLIDAAGFAAVQRRSWLMATDELRLPPPPDSSEMERSWEKAIMAPPTDRHSTWVAIDTSSDGESVVGAAALVPASDPDLSSETCLELVVFVVDPDHRGKGHGSRLLTASLRTAADRGEQEAVTWVANGDDELRRFLESTGWAADGAHRTLATGDTPDSQPDVQLRQVRLGTLLDPPAP
ncbi:MAG: GNAT family N-acetyltransferase [Actinomycetes bacterium]